MVLRGPTFGAGRKAGRTTCAHASAENAAASGRRRLRRAHGLPAVRGPRGGGPGHDGGAGRAARMAFDTPRRLAADTGAQRVDSGGREQASRAGGQGPDARQPRKRAAATAAERVGADWTEGCRGRRDFRPSGHLRRRCRRRRHLRRFGRPGDDALERVHHGNGPVHAAGFGRPYRAHVATVASVASPDAASPYAAIRHGTRATVSFQQLSGGDMEALFAALRICSDGGLAVRGPSHGA